MTEETSGLFHPLSVSNRSSKTTENSAMPLKRLSEQIGSSSGGSRQVFDPRIRQARKDKDGTHRDERENLSLSRPSVEPLKANLPFPTPTGSKEGGELLSLGSLVGTKANQEKEIEYSSTSPQLSDKNENLLEKNHLLLSDQLSGMQPKNHLATTMNKYEDSFQAGKCQEPVVLLSQEVTFDSLALTPSVRREAPNQQDPLRPTLEHCPTLSLLDGAAQSQLTASRLNGSMKPLAAQLTIFYNGMVNVYDNIPADKAQAIMLLAGSGNASVPSLYCDTPSDDKNSPLISGQHEAAANIVINSLVSRLPRVDAKTGPQSKLGLAFASSVHMSSVAMDNKQQQALRRSLASDLPVARKASLARFLERRQERVKANNACKKEREDRCSEKEDADYLHPDRHSSPKRRCITARSPSPSLVTRTSPSSSQIAPLE